MIPSAPGLSALAPDADLLLVDVWGVLHDGLAAHPDASEALRRYRANGGFVMLVSNAPRAAPLVVGFLDQLGVPRDAYDGVVTSGDVARALLARAPDDRVVYLGPAKDRPLFEESGLREAPVAEADLVLCAGFADDERETPDDYAGLLAACAARRLSMICANPDIFVERGPRLIYCAGALAERYAALGGKVVWTGKPHRVIYDAAIDIAALTLGRSIERSRILAIGDAIRTDIAGAREFGVRSLMIAQGIHAHELCDASRAIDPAKARAFFAAAAARPDALMARLAW